MNGTLKTLGDIEAMVKSVRYDYSNAIIENEQYKKINKQLKTDNKILKEILLNATHIVGEARIISYICSELNKFEQELEKIK